MFTTEEVVRIIRLKLDVADEQAAELADALADFAKEVAEMERAACARIVEEHAAQVAEFIRKRGTS
jgi:hypothetical protein